MTSEDERMTDLHGVALADCEQDVRDWMSGASVDYRGRGFVYCLGRVLAEYNRRSAEVERLQDELGFEMGMRTAAVDQLETLRRRLWSLLDADQLSDDDTVDRLRAALVARTPQPAVPDVRVVCGDVSGPAGIGGECVLPPGHPHVDGIGGQWPAVPDGEDVPARLDAARAVADEWIALQPAIREADAEPDFPTDLRLLLDRLVSELYEAPPREAG